MPKLLPNISSRIDARLSHLTSFSHGWDGDEAEPPSGRSLELASKLLDLHADSGMFEPRVGASVEGGVAISFQRGDLYADIEFLNSGEVLAVTSDRITPPVVWQVSNSVDSMTEALRAIYEFFNS